MTQNKTILQGFEWYLPNDGLHWRRLGAQAESFKKMGVTSIWMPPAYKCTGGNTSVGYDIYDIYDLGEFDQKGSVATKYGTKEEYLNAVCSLQDQGVEVLSDVVLDHMMGADETEKVMAVETAPDFRYSNISGPEEISAWTKFTFPGRGGKYSDYTWNHENFSGTDYDAATGANAIYRFIGKTWSRKTDRENGNFDYLMGAALDMKDEGTAGELDRWGRWFMDTVHPDGLRLDAVKHINYDFYKEWLKNMREYTGKDFFAVGEYWNADLMTLMEYLKNVDGCMSLFDVPLHFSFCNAGRAGSDFDMSNLKANSLVSKDPDHAVTFVDNHDTQPGQSLESWTDSWFKPLAYAQILLQEGGVPCVFYGDLFGIPHDRIGIVTELATLLKIRANFAYGQQQDYYDDAHVVGFTRLGDEEHKDSGLAVLMTNFKDGEKTMYMGADFIGKTMCNAMYPDREIVVDEKGYATFSVRGGGVAVWITKEACGRLL